jgi:hypothetical protein
LYLDDHRTALYRFYDEGGALLYVGITANTEERFAHHKNYKAWWPEVAETTIEWFDSRPPALAAELRAIHDERPVYNINGTPWASARRELEPEERTVTELKRNLTDQCRRVRLRGESLIVVDSTKARKPVAALVSFDFYERAIAALAQLDAAASG